MDQTVHGILQARIGSGEPLPLPGYLPNPGIEPRSPVLQTHSLPADPRGKLRNRELSGLKQSYGN